MHSLAAFVDISVGKCSSAAGPKATLSTVLFSVGLIEAIDFLDLPKLLRMMTSFGCELARERVLNVD